MFGNTLDEVMELQRDKFPYRKLPWIQVTLSQQVNQAHAQNSLHKTPSHMFLHI